MSPKLAPPLKPKPTLGAHAELIGQRVRLSVDDESLQVDCTVTDIKQVFGRTCALVTPIAGSGATWVNLPRLSPIKDGKK